MVYSAADIQQIFAEYYLALVEMMDHVLGDRYWVKNVASDFNSAKSRAETGNTELFNTGMVEPNILAIFDDDFNRTTIFAEELLKPEEIPQEERGTLLERANAHRVYLEEQAVGYLAMFARLSR